MRSNKLAGAWLALASSAATLPALAGGPLLVVPTSHGVLPARWEGTVNVYTDLGTLGVVNNSRANQLVRNSIREWNDVPTSNFRARIARARNLPVDQVAELVREHTEGRTFGVLGEPRVNVLALNLALDERVTR